MKRILAIFMVLLLGLATVACSPSKEEGELTILAAASLTNAIEEIKDLLEKEEDISLVPSFDSSGSLQKQIEEGAPADVFISAGQEQMDKLERKGLVEAKDRIDLLTNKLVLIVPEDNKDGIEDIEDVLDKGVQLAIAEVETAPVGQYSKQTLEDLKLWDKIDRDKMIIAKNVSEVLKHVETGNASAGLVYTSDAVRGRGVKEVEIFKENSHGPIIYPAAIIKSSQNEETARIFLEFLKKDEVKEIFKKHGFDNI